MKLDFIELKDLKPSPLNVRKHGNTSGDDLIPSIRANGILQPLLVRPTTDTQDGHPVSGATGKQGQEPCKGFARSGKQESYEVIAGQRRYNACLAIAKEQDIAPLPCAIMEEGDDVKAIEASLAENLDRLPMDEIDQYEAFRDLIRENTRDGLEATRSRGTKLGRPRKLTARQAERAYIQMVHENLNSYQIAKRFEVSPSHIRSFTREGLRYPSE